MSYNTSGLVTGGPVIPTWMPGYWFWYRTATPQGGEFMLVDPARGTRAPAFDHAKLAAALSAVTGQQYGAAELPFSRIELSDDGQFVAFDAAGRHYRCDVGGAHCADEGAAVNGGRGFGRGRARRARHPRPPAGAAVPRRTPRRLHPRLEPVGARRRHRRRSAS